MGGQVCGPEKIVQQDPLALTYACDEREMRVQHSPSQNITCTNKQIQKILETYEQNLRNEKSLYKDKSMPTDPIILKSKTNQFRCNYERPYKFLNDGRSGDSYKLIDQRDYQPSAIEVRDQVMQYFGVFLCFLSDKPSLIKKIICTGQNSFGIHCIQAYREGRVSHFFIDDYILCKDSKDPRQKIQPVFSQPIKNIYMWPCILEKAWFKIKGNSAKRVQQNTPQQVFQTFMPLPIEKYYLQDGLNTNPKQVIVNVFGTAEGLPKNNGYILKSKKSPQHDIGLSGGKYFYLLDTFIVDGKRMFYAHNTCGDMVFRGIHDEKSLKFKPALEKWNLTQSTAANFLLDEDQFAQQMAEVLIVHYLPGNKITPYCFQFENEQQFFLGFDLKYKGIFNLCVTQNSLGSNKSKAYYPLIYHVIRLSDMKLIGGSENREGCFGVKNTYLLDHFNEDAAPGKYLIRLKKKQNQHIPNVQICLVSYYMDAIKFQLPSQHQFQEKWREFLRKEGERQLALASSRIAKSNMIAHTVCWIGDVVFIYIENKQKKDQISIQVNFPELMNLQCISHPEIRRSDKWISYKFKDYFLIIFEKVDLTAETHIRQYHLESF